MIVYTTVIGWREGERGHGKTNRNQNKPNIFRAHAGGKAQTRGARGEKEEDDTNQWMERSGEGGKEKKGLQTDGHFLFLLLGVALALGQPALQLLGHALIAVLTHRLQVHLYKLVPAWPGGRGVGGSEVKGRGRGGGRKRRDRK